MERKNMWEHYTKEQERELEELAVRYRKCLDQSKTERHCPSRWQRKMDIRILRTVSVRA